MASAAATELTIREAGERVGRKPQTIKKWIRYGIQTPAGRIRLAARKVGREWLIDPAAIDDFVRRVTEATLSK